MDSKETYQQPLFHCDLFVKEDVGTNEQREDLKKQILQAKKR